MVEADLVNPPKSIEKLPGRLSRRERRKAEWRERIVETARELFSRHGYEETRVADICERADIAQKTFFNYFPSKLHLLREIAHSGVEQLLSEIEEIRKNEPATRDRVLRFFDTVAEHISEAGPSNREFLTEVVHLVSGDAAERSDQVRRLRAAFSAIIDDGLARGDVTRRHDAQALTELLIGAYYVLIFNYANLDDFPVRERASAAGRLVADSLSPRPEEQSNEQSNEQET
jgi:AcrR family transcriptional regulator